MIHCSTLAHSSFYRKLGLQRITGSCDPQVDQTICEHTSEALNRSSLPLILRIQGVRTHSTTTHFQMQLCLCYSYYYFRYVRSQQSLSKTPLTQQIEGGLPEHDTVASLLESVLARCKSIVPGNNSVTRFAASFAAAYDIL